MSQWQQSVDRAWAAFAGPRPDPKKVITALLSGIQENQQAIMDAGTSLSTSFTEIEIEGELSKLLEMVKFADLVASDYRQKLDTEKGTPLGPIAGSSATNYPLAEGVVMTFLNGLVSGNPVVHRISRDETIGALDQLMAKICRSALQKADEAVEWLQTVSVPHEESKGFHNKMSTIHFTGGHRGTELQSHTINPHRGICQMGTPNLMLVLPGGEDGALNVLRKDSRHVLSCSAVTTVLLHPEVSLGFEGNLYPHSGRGKPRVSQSYVSSLVEALAEYETAGAEMVAGTRGRPFDCLSLSKMDGEEWLRSAKLLPELFGPAYALVRSTGTNNWAEILDLLPALPRKTTTVFGVSAGDLSEANENTGRAHYNCAPSTPSLLGGRPVVHRTGSVGPCPFDPSAFWEEGHDHIPTMVVSA